MAEIIPLQSGLLPLLMQAAQKIVDRYGGIRGGESEWMIHCPIHDDKQASCHLKVSDRLLVFCHVCGKKKQEELIERLKADDLWPTFSVPKQDRPEVQQSNIPAHDVPDVFPSYITVNKINRPVTKVWTYYTANGRPAFWVLRADWVDEDGIKHKTFNAMSSYTINGKNEFRRKLTCDQRPLYNLPDIVTYRDDAIILVEGEKTADAAKEWFQDQTVITTWSGGASNWKSTDWAPLIGRRVVLWPDNDEASIKAMLDISRLIDQHDGKVLIVYQTVQDNLPAKWDLADDKPIGFSVWDTYKRALPPEPSILTPIGAKTVAEYKEQFQRLEWDGGTAIVNVKSRSHTRPASAPFEIWTTIQKFLDSETEFEIREVNGRMMRCKFAQAYIDDGQKYAVGFIFDPKTKEPRTMKGECLYLNTFMGIEHEPMECDERLYRPFLTHINGVLGELEAQWLLDFFADMFQNIARKPGVMPILTGKPGTGKSIVGNVIACILGQSLGINIQCGAVFDSKFNGMLANKLFVGFDELNLYGAANKHANETLKVLVTDPNIGFNEKYKKMTYEQSFHRFMGTTNIDVPVYIDMSDRRYAVLSVSDAFKENKAHFNAIAEIMKDPIALSGLHFYFKNREIKTSLYDIPRTEARTKAQRPENPIMDMLYGWVNEGSLPEEIRGRLMHCEWPQESVIIPRSIISEYVRKRHPSLAPTRITQTLMPYLKWDRSDGKSNNTVRMTVYTADGRGQKEINERVFELKPIHELRRIYELESGTKPHWEEIEFDEGPSDDVAPF